MKGGKWLKTAILIVLVLSCLGLTHYLYITFSHFLYVPIVLAGFWWGRRAIWVAVLLGALLVGFHDLSNLDAPFMLNLIRSAGFIAVGLAVGLLREHNMRYESELRKAKEEKENIIANFLDTLIVTNLDGNIRFVNKATLELLEYEEEELIGKSIGTIFAEEEVRPLFTGTLEELREKGRVQDYELTYLTKSGRRIPMSFNASVIRDERGEIAGIVAGAKDISKIREVEAELRQAQKMEAVGRLAGGVAHDFNNLLTAIQGYIELAMMEVQEDAPLNRYLEEIRKASVRAANLTRQLLLFSRSHPIKVVTFDLNKAIEDMAKMLRRIIGEDISLALDLSAGLWAVEGDTGSIEQVVMNLVVNARDAMPEGGKIAIKTENVSVDEEYCSRYSYARPGRFVRLSVKDTGIGMDRATMERIFDPFFTTKKEGTGLGLSVVYGIVKQHKGWINVESSPGLGSTFRVYLPAALSAPEEEGEEILPEALRGNGERVLVVEDERPVRDFIEKALSESGYVVSVATNAKEAIEIFKRKKGKFDLVFTDVVLPDERGPKLVQQLLALQPGMGVLFTSGYTNEKSDWLVIREKGYPYIQKPYTLADLLRAVREALHISRK